nr:hypothetical protein [Tanacetum cinerariifolium]
MRDAVAQTRSEKVFKISNDPLLTGVNTPQSGEDILKLNELIDLCTNLQDKKLKKNQRSRTHKLKRLYKVGLSARVESSDNEDITLVNDQEMFDADKDLQGEEVVVKQEVVADKELIVDVAQVSAAATTFTIDAKICLYD